MSLNLPALQVSQEVGAAKSAGIAEACGVRFRGDAVGQVDLPLYWERWRRTYSILPMPTLPSEEKGSVGTCVIFPMIRSWTHRFWILKFALGWGRNCLPGVFRRRYSKTRQAIRLHGSCAKPVPRQAEGMLGRSVTTESMRWAYGSAGCPAWAIRPSSDRAAEPLLAKIFNLPCMRRTDAPPAPVPWTVDDPIPFPEKSVLSIQRPESGSVYWRVGESFEIRPKANLGGELLWFLNGRPLCTEEARRTMVGSGSYELLCLSPTGSMLFLDSGFIRSLPNRGPDWFHP